MGAAGGGEMGSCPLNIPYNSHQFESLQIQTASPSVWALRGPQQRQDQEAEPDTYQALRNCITEEFQILIRDSEHWKPSIVPLQETLGVNRPGPAAPKFRPSPYFRNSRLSSSRICILPQKRHTIPF